MAWLKKDCRLRGHPKLIACADALDLKPVYLEGHLDSFWLACLERHEDGDISGMSNTEIAILAEYNTKNADRFVQLLQKHRWLDDHLIHDWLDYVGDYLKGKYRKSPEKLLAIYKKHGREIELKKTVHVGTCPVRVPDVYVTSQDRDRDKETTHTQPPVRVDSISDFESVFSASYQTVLSVYREVTGRKGTDRNTKEGARTLALAMDAGEMTESQLREVVKNGMADEKLPNQSLRGIANNWERYLQHRDAPDVPKKDSWQCQECGMVHSEVHSPSPANEHPVRCKCGGVRVLMRRG